MIRQLHCDGGPWALVTGACGGIGRALVSEFEQAGYRVIAVDCVPRPEGFGAAKYLRFDLEDLCTGSDAAGEFIRAVQNTVGDVGLSALVNNAAVQILGGLETLSPDDWTRTLNVNLIAPFFLIQNLLKALESAQGAVVNISSIHAQLTKPQFVAYSTSKAALSGLTRALAVDVGHRIRINAIEPAAIGTEMLKAGFSQSQHLLQELERCHPQGRVGDAVEVARLAVALCSPLMAFLNGACVSIAGGIAGRLHDPT